MSTCINPDWQQEMLSIVTAYAEDPQNYTPKVKYDEDNARTDFVFTKDKYHYFAEHYNPMYGSTGYCLDICRVRTCDNTVENLINTKKTPCFREYKVEKVMFRLNQRRRKCTFNKVQFHEYTESINRCELCELRGRKVSYFEENHRDRHTHLNSQRMMREVVDEQIKNPPSPKTKPFTLPINCLDEIISYL